jgi:aspartyl-tRNA(Asn)/glutamyl-tRNA(Gln) amidotransferase subunit A
VAPASGTSTPELDLPADAAAALERAKRHSALHAFTWLAQSAPAHGAGLLAGVPVAVKDLMGVEGVPLSGGSRALDRAPAPRDAEVVARLKRAGAVVIGMANLHELAYGITSDNPHFGRVVNPRSPDRIPGGSSGGSAAAIAAGIVNLAVGTDTAGSIRIPAACCGVVGFKPSYDAVPRAGVMDLAPTLDHVGPMGRTVEDCAMMFAAMLGLDVVPPWAFPDLSGRAGVILAGYFADPLDAQVGSARDEAAAALAQDGARCVERSVDGMELAPPILVNTICAEATAVHAERLSARGSDMGEDVRVRLEMGHFIPGHWYLKAQRLRTRLVAQVEAAFGDARFMLSPTLRTPAPRVDAPRVEIGGKAYALHTAVTNLTLPFNLAGLPAISVPWTRSRDGVPIAMQVIGRRGEDWATLGIAQRLQAASPWHRDGMRER